MADAGLPFGWEVRHSKSKNLPYYFNEDLKQSRWEPPPGTDHNKLRAYVLQHHSSAPSEGRSLAQDLGVTTNNNEKIRAEITRSKDEALKIMLALEERIRCGVKTLGELAMTESDCSSAKKQGDLGFFGKGDMQKEFEDVAFTLRPGEISQIIESPSGLHLIQRLE